ncbi:50S ribosomal protein L30, partial [candidate division MSBL1 archaeon SCGC-AAA382C18]
GEINSDTLEKLLVERGELKGGKSVTDDIIQEKTPYETLEEFAEAVCNDEATLEDIDELKEVFRLHPPKKGFEMTRRSFEHGGALGFRGEEINGLIQRMI